MYEVIKYVSVETDTSPILKLKKPRITTIDDHQIIIKISKLEKELKHQYQLKTPSKEKS